MPTADYVVQSVNGPRTLHVEVGPWAFVAITLVLGFFMSLGKAAVYKDVPAYYPENVGAAGGLVGMIGGLGGFVLPLLFGVLNDLTGLRSSCFMALFVIVVAAFVCMHLAATRLEARAPVQVA
jgi:NNP family nitrate/nitrite transporter-like MFS transporter